MMLIWLKRIGIGMGAFLGVLLLLLAVVAGERMVRLTQTLALIDGDWTLDGLSGPLAIDRDDSGIPHIKGAADLDVYFGLGVAHAQDRMWQMDMWRRVAHGTMAEIFGPPAFKLDRITRPIGLEKLALANYEGLAPATRAVLDAYTRGVNWAIEQRGARIAPEYVLTFSKPAPWRPHDSITVLHWIAVGLSENGWRELARQKLIRQVGLERALELIPPFDNGRPIVMPDAGLPGLPHKDGGSNNWVLSGDRTASGKPILANDPHMGLTAPAAWYLVHLAFPDQNVVGASLPGFPSVILGRNDDIAWGMTNTGTDVQDLFVERLNEADPNRYATPEGPAAFETRTETVKVRFGKARTITVRTSRHGPVFADSFTQGNGFDPKKEALALSWTLFDDADKTVEAGIHAPRARDWDAFEAALSDFGVPMQNVVFAEKSGRIAFLVRSRVPVRKPGNDINGRYPAPGDDPRYDWAAIAPTDSLPTLVDPPSGQIITANNRIVPEDYPLFFTYEWADGLRAKRLESLINQQDKMTPELSLQFQLDTYSLFAKDLLPLLKVPDELSAPAAEARDLFSSWDGDMAADRPEPLIFMAFMRSLTKAIVADEMGPAFGSFWAARPYFLRRALAGQEPEVKWCDRPDTARRLTCQDLLSEAFEDAIAELARTYGDDPAAWRWGEAHKAKMAHLPFGQVPILKQSFNIEVPTGGGPFTPNQGNVNWRSATPYANLHGPAFRSIYDFADLDASLYIQSSGQSGNPLSRHYSDLTRLWADGRMVMIPTVAKDGETPAHSMRFSSRQAANPNN